MKRLRLTAGMRFAYAYPNARLRLALRMSANVRRNMSIDIRDKNKEVNYEAGGFDYLLWYELW